MVDAVRLGQPLVPAVWDVARNEPAAPEAVSNRRYVGGQRLYLEQARPHERSTWVLDNTDLDRPRLTRSSAPSAPADPPAPGQQTLRPEATFL